jgi:hypothetical protein
MSGWRQYWRLCRPSKLVGQERITLLRPRPQAPEGFTGLAWHEQRHTTGVSARHAEDIQAKRSGPAQEYALGLRNSIISLQTCLHSHPGRHHACEVAWGLPLLMTRVPTRWFVDHVQAGGFTMRQMLWTQIRRTAVRCTTLTYRTR